MMPGIQDISACNPRPSADTKRSEQIRNRENQRRLRERRQVYVKELEARLRTLERDGVRASEYIQGAARVVVEENRLLRRLLHSHGFFKTAVDEYLRNATTTDVPESISPPHRPHLAFNTTLLTRGRPTVVPNAHNSPIHARLSSLGDSSAPAAARENEYSWTLELGSHGTLVEASSMVIPSITASVKDRQIAQPQAVNLVASSMYSASATAHNRTAIDEMDCEKAAHIITTLRGGGDSEDVWPELGCSGVHRTSVKNVHIMSLAG